MPAVLDRRVSGNAAKELDRVLKPFEEGGRYVAQNFDRLLDEHGEGWIALRGKQVVAHSKSRLGLRQRLTRQRLKPSQVYTTYLTSKKRTLIL